MDKYLLNTEKKEIDNITEMLSNSLDNKDIEDVKVKFNNIIKETKDYSIEDILNYILEEFAKDLSPLLDENYTPGLQAGIKNKNFNLSLYGGYYNGKKEKEIDENTMFSFDSVSKILTSIIAAKEPKTTISQLNKDFNLDTNIQDILNFTAMIRTDRRIDNLSPEDTIKILKNVKEDLEEKKLQKNFYQYNDIGYMILRLSIDNFILKLDNLLNLIDDKNLTYKNFENKSLITGGKLEEEFLTPDRKGREIIFPGHTGLYGNITGLLNLFENFIENDKILSKEEKEELFKQPYPDPKVYTKDGNIQTGKNGSPQYMAKIAGIYRKPNGITSPDYSKMASCDISEISTDNAKASTGTSGAWTVYDNIENFGSYVGGLLTNPYSYVKKDFYENSRNEIPNTNLTVNQNGVILGYQTKLNYYKDLITKYGLLLELLTKYIEKDDKKALDSTKKLVKKI